MTNPTTDDALDEVFDNLLIVYGVHNPNYPNNSKKRAKQAIKALITKTLNDCLPEKIDPDAPALAYKDDEQGFNRLAHWRSGRNDAIAETQANFNRLMGGEL